MKKFITKFDTTAELTTFSATTDFGRPHVSLTEDDSKVHYFGDPTHNSPEYVDLGLPSGLKWATCNVGATSPEEYGLYFAWGETTGYTANDVTSGVRAFTQDEYNAGPAASISADLTLEQDAAHVNMGGNWRMPTKDECQELINNCNGVYTTDYNGTGVTGILLTSKANNNSIFLPCASFYADSSIRDASIYSNASFMSVENFYGFVIYPPLAIGKSFRFLGCQVRAVCE